MTSVHHYAVKLPVGTSTGSDVKLEGNLALPPHPAGVVIFAHGSGSSRFSPRNNHVASVMNEAGLGTLLFDLLTEEEEESERTTRHLRFDIGLLAGRLADVVGWTAGATGDLDVGLFGSSTGAAAALVAAARLPERVKAVVSRGGRPDLAGDFLPRVRAPTLLIVGGEDREVLMLNREAADRMQAKTELVVIPGATHLFEEPGTLDQAANQAARWFTGHLSAPKPLRTEETQPPLH